MYNISYKCPSYPDIHRYDRYQKGDLLVPIFLWIIVFSMSGYLYRYWISINWYPSRYLWYLRKVIDSHGYPSMIYPVNGYCGHLLLVAIDNHNIQLISRPAQSTSRSCWWTINIYVPPFIPQPLATDLPHGYAKIAANLYQGVCSGRPPQGRALPAPAQ